MSKTLSITTANLPPSMRLNRALEDAIEWALPLFEKGCLGLFFGRESDSIDHVIQTMAPHRRFDINEDVPWFIIMPKGTEESVLFELDYDSADEEALLHLTSLHWGDMRIEGAILRPNNILLISQREADGGERAGLLFWGTVGGHEAFDAIEAVKRDFPGKFEFA